MLHPINFVRLCFHFYLSQDFFLFSLWSIGCLEVCCLIFTYLCFSSFLPVFDFLFHATALRKYAWYTHVALFTWWILLRWFYDKIYSLILAYMLQYKWWREFSFRSIPYIEFRELFLKLKPSHISMIPSRIQIFLKQITKMN